MSDETRILSDAEMDAIEAEAEARIAAARARPADPAVEARVQDLLRRPYRMEVSGDPEEGYLARAPELPGCFTAGETPTEAMAMLRDAMATWLESAVLDGAPIPEPGATGEQHSGRILLRMPRSLHRALAEAADAEGVSTNQYITTLLVAGVGRPLVQIRPPLLAGPGVSGVTAILQGPPRFLRQADVESFQEAVTSLQTMLDEMRAGRAAGQEGRSPRTTR